MSGGKKFVSNVTPVGDVRPSQLLWTYGPGAEKFLGHKSKV